MSLLNTPIEISLRLLVVLDEWHPSYLSLGRLVLLDYVLVHSGDLNGPASLHPDLPGKSGEFGVRRELIRNGLAVLLRANLAEALPVSTGITYRAGESSSGFLNLFESTHLARLRDRGRWLNGQFRDVDDRSVRSFLQDLMDQSSSQRRS